MVSTNHVCVPEVYPTGEGQGSVKCDLDGKFLAPGEVEGEGNGFEATLNLARPDGGVSLEEGDFQPSLIARDRVKLSSKDCRSLGWRER